MSEHGPEEPVLPDRSDDDRDRGWGGSEDSRADDPDSPDPDDERFTRERPPHW